MKRTWLALLAAAVLAGGCGSGNSSSRLATDEHDAVEYATADYRATMTRFQWPRSATVVTLLVARASCRAASYHYKVKHVDVVAAAFARRARTLDRAHKVSSRPADLRAACSAGIERRGALKSP
jgi:hypothetical protein